MKTAIVTSATKNMTQQDMAERPLAGSLFAFPGPVSGFTQTLARLS